jgi:hypothetical protein
MSQNLISLVLTTDQLTAIDGALATLEQNLSGLLALQPSQRRELYKMGEKSEQFGRQTLHVLSNNPQIVPPSLGLADAQQDMATLDALRPRMQRMKQLVERGVDTEMALGSDIMSTALEGYGLLKVSGKNQGLDGLRQELSTRFAKTRRPAAVPAS